MYKPVYKAIPHRRKFPFVQVQVCVSVPYPSHARYSILAEISNHITLITLTQYDLCKM